MGIAGVRLLGLDGLLAAAVAPFLIRLRARCPEAILFAWTPGLPWARVAGLPLGSRQERDLSELRDDEGWRVRHLLLEEQAFGPEWLVVDGAGRPGAGKTYATEAAVANLGGSQPGSALVFDCVATRLRIGDAFGLELESVGRTLNGAHFVGCNTYGQLARAEGQFGGFHNCTAVVMVLPA